MFNGDIRNESVLREIQKAYGSFDGIIHLVAVSDERWCEENHDDCFKINVDGTRAFLQTVQSLFTTSKKNPWLLYTSSYSVYESSYAENVISTFASVFSNIAILRISEIYGSFHDYSHRTVPYFVRSALTDNPITLSEIDLFKNYIHISDVVRACRKLIEQMNSNRDMGERHSVRKFLLTGHTVDQKTLLMTILNLTNSQSLLRIENFIKDVSPKPTIREQLNYTLIYPTIQKGLQEYIDNIRKRDLFRVKEIFDDECSGKFDQDIPVNNCTMIIYTNLMTRAMLTCSLNKSLTTTNKFSPYLRFITTETKDSQGVPSYYIQCLSRNPGFLTVLNRRVITSTVGTPFWISYFPKNRSMALLVHQNHQGKTSFLVLSDGSLQLWDENTYPFFMSPYCCEGKSSLPFLNVDPLLEKRKELSWLTMPETLNNKCGRLKTFIALEEIGISQRLNLLKMSVSNLSMAEDKLWNNSMTSDRPLCDTDCFVFSGCIRLFNCRCVFDRCNTKQLYPYHNLIRDKSLNSASPHSDVADVPIERLLKVDVRVFFQHFEMPRIHVLELPSMFLPHYNDEKRYKMQLVHCFNADHAILTEFTKTSTDLSKAELVIIPYFHGFYIHYRRIPYIDQINLLEQIHAFAMDKLTKVNSSAKLVFILTHDTGGCVGYVADHIDLIHHSFNHQIPVLRNAYVLQPNGDFNTNCYYPHKDIVIPPLTCLTSSLVSTFGDIQRVKHILNRRVFAFFKGHMHGTGSITRSRLSCPNLFTKTSTNQTYLTSLIQQYYQDSDYLTTLNETRFCLIVPGTTGWSTRFVDAVYAGCVPVLITTSTHHPFEDILDYETFSIHIPENQVDRLEEKLMGYTNNDLVLKQQYLLKVRDIFIYKNYENQSHQFNKQNDPLFFILLSLRMRLKLQLI